MKRPLLQIALDHTDLKAALESAGKVAEEVDVIEAGTILCYAEGAKAVKQIHDAYPGHTIVADLKAADAGEVVANLVFSRGASWMTCICNAPLATMEAAKKVADTYSGEIQVELYGAWSFDLAAKWLDIGINQAIYHRGRDAAAAGQNWSDEDIQKIRHLGEMGFAVSVTGGLAPQDLSLFRGIPVKCFIAGRSLYEAKNPIAAARAFKQAIRDNWNQG
ncbi:3-keto-L-gulonate-6-phosphate decarboxylase UlaD [Sediminispirochaeta bajacaliforniensis]|uniref:3-keto-L-gulonate-6-phosphate decarboxylase UlaD n=1 Tax=Sediminispirochaeta bajacaliforniensis TaxID=148 RepID=UPI000376DAE8|nr:3-keto-L-gulonate-6-phosphate decarboxylase UlaD [Sediminispirochaeta bajacaliforniensis]